MILRTVKADIGPIVYPAARDRTGGLAGGLTAAGFDVRLVEAYRADPATSFAPAVRAALVAGDVDGILLYSARTARTLIAIAEGEGLVPRLARPMYFVISPYVADIVAGLGAAVRVADNPDEDSLLALVSAAV